MKRCPTCQRVYEDDGMSYCLEDGAALVSDSMASSDAATVRIPAARLTEQTPTEVLPASDLPPVQPAPQFAHQRHARERTAPVERKTSALPWILGAALVLGLSGIVIALILTRNRDADNSQVAQNTSQSANATPAAPDASPAISQMETPAVAPSSTVAAQREMPKGISGQPSPTPKATPSPRRTPETAVTDEPPPRPQPTPTPAPERRVPISGGVLNSKAISKPAPPYPAVAKAARASGTVTVQVLIDESGRVISARAVSGHPLLQQAAAQAARQARFSPTLLSGQPVKVSGIITYNFVLQ